MFKIKLPGGGFYKNPSGRVQHYESRADALHKIKRLNKRGRAIGATVVDVTGKRGRRKLPASMRKSSKTRRAKSGQGKKHSRTRKSKKVKSHGSRKSGKKASKKKKAHKHGSRKGGKTKKHRSGRKHKSTRRHKAASTWRRSSSYDEGYDPWSAL